MNISGDLRERLAVLETQRDTYMYCGQNSLKEKVLTRLVAPTAIGKSTIINRLLELAEAEGINAAEVGTITTRPSRPTDPPNYRTADDGITHESLIEQIEAGELVSWSLFETGHLYATDYDSYPGTYNFLPCLPDSLPMQDKAGFGAVHTFYIVTSVESWHEQLQERRGPGFNDRLEEAMSSLEFGQSTEDIHKLVSLSGERALSQTAKRILDHSMNDDVNGEVHELVYGVAEHHINDLDFNRHCQNLYRLAMQLVGETNKQEIVVSLSSH